ncbi:MAG: YcgN family cysteine cluster protein [Caulobacteraceae bacterium]
MSGKPLSQPTSAVPPFWEVKRLDQMTPVEWESLCDGCGRCCLIRFEDEDTGEIIPTRVACRLLDTETCRCTRYEHRKRFVPDCIKLTPGKLEHLTWMPRSCAYRRLYEGRPLADWHPLISGDPESTHRAGVGIRGQVISETVFEDVEDAIDFAASDLNDDPTEG